MKTTILILLFALSSTLLQAQFSADPHSPLAICDTAGAQDKVRALADGEGGFYVFWRDGRGGGQSADVYAQHLDKNGNELWAKNGIALVSSQTSKVTAFRCTHVEGGILVAWIQSTVVNSIDTLYAMKYDLLGVPIWTSPIVIASEGSGVLTIDEPGFEVFETGGSVTITYSVTFTGGSTLFGYNRIDSDGNRFWNNNETIKTKKGYDFRAASDGANGFYGLAKGNGLGSPIHIQHYGYDGVASWPAEVDITTGGQTNGFAGEISLIHDGNGNLYCVWDANSGSVLAAKITKQGVLEWNSPKRVTVNTAGQSRSNALFANGHLFVVWNDTRVPNQTSLFAQKIDPSGQIVWSEEGVLIGVTNGYYSTPRLATSVSESISCVFLGLGTVDLQIQVIAEDGSVKWPDNGITLASVPQDWVFYTDFDVVGEQSGCNAVFWTTISSKNIFGAKACADSVVSVATEINPSASNTLELRGNTIEWQLNQLGSTNAKIEVFNLQGQLVRWERVAASAGSIDLSAINTGAYLVRLTNGPDFISKTVGVYR